MSSDNLHMHTVPNSPEAFFGSYIPQHFSVVPGVGQLSSSGSVVFAVPGVGVWVFRLVKGQLIQESAEASDVVVRITIPEPSFEPIVVRGTEHLATLGLSAERQMLAFRALTLDAERVRQIRSVVGSVCFAVVDGAVTDRVYVTPGNAQPNLVQPECEVSCDADAFWGLQSGTQNPFELLMSGKIRIAGDAQIPMALSALFL